MLHNDTELGNVSVGDSRHSISILIDDVLDTKQLV